MLEQGSGEEGGEGGYSGSVQLTCRWGPGAAGLSLRRWLLPCCQLHRGIQETASAPQQRHQTPWRSEVAVCAAAGNGNVCELHPSTGAVTYLMNGQSLDALAFRVVSSSLVHI